MKEHWINTSSFSYPVIIGRGSLNLVGSIIVDKKLVNGEKVAVITSEHIREFWGADVEKSFEGTGLDMRVIPIPDGEVAKELRTLGEIYGELAGFGMHRDSLIVALGGGSVSDVAGFAASTYLRGIDYMNVPTTFLAQIDSCVGGKTGINHEGGKNLVGTFWQPKAVVVDPDIIATLEPRQILSGIAEVVKSAVISDETLFNVVEEKFDAILNIEEPELLDEIIERALLIKAQVVEADEIETRGYRVLLNFGHTYGHAYEALLRVMGRPISHGEAVALGMLTESRLANLLGMLDEFDEARIAKLSRRISDPRVASGLRWDDINMWLNIDKKARDEGKYFVLPTGIGSVEVVGDIDEDFLVEAWRQTIGKN